MSYKEELLQDYSQLLNKALPLPLDSALDSLNKSQKNLLLTLQEESKIPTVYIYQIYLYDLKLKKSGKSRSGDMRQALSAHIVPDRFLTLEQQEEQKKIVKKRFFETHPQYSYSVKQKYNHAGIYLIACKNSILYVGQSKDMQKRIIQHISKIKENDKEKKYQILHEALESNLPIDFDVLEYAEESDLDDREAFWINKLTPPLNTMFPQYRDQKKQHSLIDQVNDLESALMLGKKRESISGFA